MVAIKLNQFVLKIKVILIITLRPCIILYKWNFCWKVQKKKKTIFCSYLFFKLEHTHIIKYNNFIWNVSLKDLPKRLSEILFYDGHKV